MVRKMSNAKICDMCGCVIKDRYDIAPRPRFVITIQKVRLLNPEIITVDLCQNCFDSICEINRKKNEGEDK